MPSGNSLIYVPNQPFSSSRILLEKSSDPSQPTKSETSPQTTPPLPSSEAPVPPKNEPTVSRVPQEDLPSHREGQRWNLSKRLTEIMDELLPKLAVVTQKVNNYTGTDYSGIEALRRAIKEQEQVVKSRRAAVDEAKRTLDAAHAQQASAQKEVVGLLERKHSWSAADLERYMALIRSEHINDQAVQAAKDSVLAADTALEEARSQLEKKERSQYHEEQIWSDTIRRNSTWVTFGLMGLNIFLLLTSLVIIDPWRRRRLVREIRSALDEQKPVPAPPPAPLDVPLVEAAIDSVVEAAGLSLESLGEASVQKPVQEPVTPISSDEQSPVAEAVAASAEELKSADSPEVSKPSAVKMSQEVETTSPHSENAKPVGYIPSTTSPLSWRDTLRAAIRRSKEYIRDLFSDRHITVRKVDLTAATLEGACAGAILMSLLLVLVRQK